MRFRQQGVSLVEAIVAMAVMAFGMLAIVAVQATLRLNSDMAKQRSEAVRIAQEAIEDWRAFSTIGTTAGQVAFADIAAAPASAAVSGYTTNTEYLLTRSVAGGLGQGLDSIQVAVSWSDRSGEDQVVTLNSIIAAADPALSGALGLQPAGSPTKKPLGRHGGIPVTAKDLGDGTSVIKPPGPLGETIAWVFGNSSGVVQSICTVAASTNTATLQPADLSNCASNPSYLITGYVRFSFGATPNALAPADTQIDLGVLAIAIGAGNSDGQCFVEPVQNPALPYTAYYCLVPRNADGTWTGRTVLAAPLDLALYDVCRYSSGSGGNAGHPEIYVHLQRSLGSQNFIVITQGMACPSTPPAPTLPHQPPVT